MLAGCLPPPKMRLSNTNNPHGQRGVWWAAPAATALRGPVVGVEQRVSKNRVVQWLVDDRGVRRFEYRGGLRVSAGPPVSTEAYGSDFSVARPLIRMRFGNPDEPGWPGPALPPDQVRQLTGSADLAELLAQHWPDSNIDPPANMSPHEIEQAAEAAEITVFDLIKSGM